MKITPEECAYRYEHSKMNPFKAVSEMAKQEGVDFKVFWEWMKDNKIVDPEKSYKNEEEKIKEKFAVKDKFYTDELFKKVYKMRTVDKMTYKKIARELNIPNSDSLNTLYLDWLKQHPELTTEKSCDYGTKDIEKSCNNCTNDIEKTCQNDPNIISKIDVDEFLKKIDFNVVSDTILNVLNAFGFDVKSYRVDMDMEEYEIWFENKTQKLAITVNAYEKAAE